MENLKPTKKIILTFLSKMHSITLIPLEEIVTKVLASIINSNIKEIFSRLEWLHFWEKKLILSKFITTVCGIRDNVIFNNLPIEILILH